jgi:predicted metal-dependent phosphotriesterase family hydrolase
VILSSDLGQAANGPVVAGFARLLDRLRHAGMGDDEVRMMIVDNPRKLLAGRGLGK